jgi:clan AA aspartic protease (TIGR02281 family)
VRHILFAGAAVLALTGCQPSAPVPQASYGGYRNTDDAYVIDNNGVRISGNAPHYAAAPPPAAVPYQPRDLCEEHPDYCAPAPTPPDAAPQRADAPPMPSADAVPQSPPIPDPSPPVEAPHSASIALQREANGSFLIPVSVDNAPAVHFLLDSGASDVVLPRWLAAQLIIEGKLTDADYRGQGTAVLADGSSIGLTRFRLATVQIGNVIMHDIECTATYNDGAPLLGLSALNKFRSWMIDPRASTLNVTWD